MKAFVINSSVDSVDFALRPDCALAGELGRVVHGFGLVSGVVEGIECLRSLAPTVLRVKSDVGIEGTGCRIIAVDIVESFLWRVRSSNFS